MYRITTFEPDGSVRSVHESTNLLSIGVACMFLEEVGVRFTFEEVDQ
ncbi:hypothetical protein KL86CLO1_11103 [uncultured Eubacteriales bacterium]|uniref:Uncharacterized protein n=1 Tax=uncultured Eubacteriales bacterium TaxID=172733 RepID=A0A212JHL4_9FIRM|nr:hypothetical protein KL86CLO1_11103 [uncultured Eubacteriales bacterium]